MKIVSCPHCQSELQVEAEWSGQEVSCPTCSQSFTVTFDSEASQPLPADDSDSNIQQTNRLKRKKNLYPRTPNIQNNIATQNTGYCQPQGNEHQSAGYPPEPGFTDVARRKMNNLVSSMTENQEKTRDNSILLSVISWFIVSNLFLISKIILKISNLNSTLVVISLLVISGVLAAIGVFSAIICKCKGILYFSAALLANAILNLIVFAGLR